MRPALPWQRHSRKRKLQTSIPHEHRCKGPPQNTSKLNLTIHTKNWLWPSEIYPRNAKWFCIWHAINVIYHINRRTKKNTVIIAIDGIKAFDQIQHSFMKKQNWNLGLKGNTFNLIKRCLWKTSAADSRLHGQRPNIFLLRLGVGQGSLLLPLLLNFISESPGHRNKGKNHVVICTYMYVCVHILYIDINIQMSHIHKKEAQLFYL